MTRFVLLGALLLAGCIAEIEGAESGAPAPSGDDPQPPPPPPAGGGRVAIVLAHGLGGDADSFDPSIVTAIEALGYAVKRTEVPAVESVAVRAAALRPQIDAFLAATGAAKVHVIAHSMGGLDARYLISKLGYANRVASLTTISTPHRGSPLADVALGFTQSSQLSQSKAIDAILDIVGNVDRAALERALFDLSVRQAPAFNAAVPDAVGVAYFSYAGYSTPDGSPNTNAAVACGVMPPGDTPALLSVVQPVVANGSANLPSDAVVTIASAQWGQFAGCLAADHLAENGPATATYNAPVFYRSLATKLASL